MSQSRSCASIVMPCLNEVETLGACIREARESLVANGLWGEIVIADNGSTDGSQEIAEQFGARVVHVEGRGYGNALRVGIAAARGDFIVVGDSDGSYSFADVPRFVESLRSGYDLVMGNRFKGGIEPGAMPWHHRYIGNPILSGIGRLLFRCPVRDFHCGLRAFRKDAYERMGLVTTGMEFASEMVIKATLLGMRIAEIPTVLRPDGRSRPPHLRSFRDGWRHLRFMLLYCPLWLFGVAGVIFLFAGLLTVGAIGVAAPLVVDGVHLSVNTSCAAAMAAILGYQLLMTGVFARRLGTVIGTHPPHHTIERFSRWISLERGVLVGLGLVALGFVLLLSAWLWWRGTGFGTMPPSVSIQRVIPAVMSIVLGVQTVFTSFLLGLIEIVRTAPTGQRSSLVNGTTVNAT